MARPAGMRFWERRGRRGGLPWPQCHSGIYNSSEFRELLVVEVVILARRGARCAGSVGFRTSNTRVIRQSLRRFAQSERGGLLGYRRPRKSCRVQAQREAVARQL